MYRYTHIVYIYIYIHILTHKINNDDNTYSILYRTVLYLQLFRYTPAGCSSKAVAAA